MSSGLAWIALALALTLAACAPSATAPSPTPSPPPSASPTSPIATLTPAPSDTPDLATQRRTLRLWLVEPLASDGAVPAVLLEQLQAFRALNPNVTFDVRVKLASGTDGVLQVLRSTLSVAPAALPDLVLLDRADLVSAASAGQVQQLEGRLAEELVSDFFPVAREMGAVNGELYGAAYVLDAQHLVFRQAAFKTPPARLADILSGPAPYLFPAGNSDTIVGQYLAGGGRLVDDEGRPVVDEGPLLAALRFYEQGIKANVIPLTTLEFDHPDDYIEDFLDGMSSVVNINASTYLRRRSEMPNVGVARIPAPETPSVTVVTGWSWAMVTTDPDRQVLVVELLNWLLQPERQGAFSRASRVLPSQHTALQIWGDEAYSAFAESLLADAVLRPASAERASTAQALQEALRDVLLERYTAEEAVSAAASRFDTHDS